MGSKCWFIFWEKWLGVIPEVGVDYKIIIQALINKSIPLWLFSHRLLDVLLEFQLHPLIQSFSSTL